MLRVQKGQQKVPILKKMTWLCPSIESIIVMAATNTYQEYCGYALAGVLTVKHVACRSSYTCKLFELSLQEPYNMYFSTTFDQKEL